MISLPFDLKLLCVFVVVVIVVDIVVTVLLSNAVVWEVYCERIICDTWCWMEHSIPTRELDTLKILFYFMKIKEKWIKTKK